MRRSTLLAAAAGAIAATALAGGVAWATIPAANGVINACYRLSEDDQKGQVRVVSDPTACRSNEAPIAWNQVGPRGPQGERGLQGEQGPAGRDGAKGADGVSVNAAAEGPGANCAAGGIQLTAVNSISYVCNGRDGRDGTNGADGDDGTSVTSAAEPAGSNCANGGSRFTAANGVTYACNGAGGGTSGWEIIRTDPKVLDPGQVAEVTAVCPLGKKALGGGFFTSLRGVAVTYLYPSLGDGGRSGLTAEFVNNTSGKPFARVDAICANVP